MVAVSAIRSEIKPRLFSRSSWHRSWLCDVGQAVAFLNGWLGASALVSQQRGAFLIAYLFVFVGGFAAVLAIFSLVDITLFERVPALREMPLKFRLFHIPAVVVASWLSVFAGAEIVFADMTPVIGIGTVLLCNVVTVGACLVLVHLQ